MTSSNRPDKPTPSYAVQPGLFTAAIYGDREYGTFGTEGGWEEIRDTLDRVKPEQILLVDSGDGGAPSYVRSWAWIRNVPFVEFHANWELLGKRAGYAVNQTVLDKDPDIVLTFGHNTLALHMADIALDKQVPVESDGVPRTPRAVPLYSEETNAESNEAYNRRVQWWLNRYLPKDLASIERDKRPVEKFLQVNEHLRVSFPPWMDESDVHKYPQPDFSTMSRHERAAYIYLHKLRRRAMQANDEFITDEELGLDMAGFLINSIATPWGDVDIPTSKNPWSWHQPQVKDQMGDSAFFLEATRIWKNPNNNDNHYREPALIGFNTPRDMNPDQYIQAQEVLLKHGFKDAYSVALGTSRNNTIHAILDEDAPSQFEYNYIARAGYFNPDVTHGVSRTVASSIGKNAKRMRLLSFGGKGMAHAYTTSEKAADKWNSIPIETDNGKAMNLKWWPWIHGDYNIPTATTDAERAKQTDGAGMAADDVFDQLYEEMFGKKPDRKVELMQFLMIGGEIEAGTIPGVRDAGGIKLMLRRVPRKHFNAKMERELVRQGIDPAKAPEMAKDLGMTLSIESIHTQAANNNQVVLRIIPHDGYRHQVDDIGTSGHSLLPALSRVSPMEAIADHSMSTMAKKVFNAENIAENKAQSIDELLQNHFGDDKGISKWDGDALSPENLAKALRFNSLLRMMESSQYAVENGSPFVNQDVMLLNAPSMSGQTRGWIEQAKGEGTAIINNFRALLFPVDFLPDLLSGPPDRSTIRTVSSRVTGNDEETYYHNYLVLNPWDVVDPEVIALLSGQDFDDHTHTILYYNRDHEVMSFSYRDPLNAGGGIHFAIPQQDLDMLVKAGAYIYPTYDEAEWDLYQNELGAYSIKFSDIHQRYSGEAHSPVTMNRIGQMRQSPDPMTRLRGDAMYLAIMLHHGKVGSLSNLQALMLRSGWMDTDKDMMRYYVDLGGTAIDYENFGIGSNEKMEFEMARGIILDMMDDEDRKIDPDSYKHRFTQFGIRGNVLAKAYADIQLERQYVSEEDRMEYWRYPFKDEWKTHDWWKFMNEDFRAWIDKRILPESKYHIFNEYSEAMLAMGKEGDRSLLAMANGRPEFLTARRYTDMPTTDADRFFWIQRRAAEAGDALVKLHYIFVGMQVDHMDKLTKQELRFKTRKNTRGMTRKQREDWLLQIRGSYNHQMEEKLKGIFLEVDAKLTERVRLYEPYMLMAAFKQGYARLNNAINAASVETAFAHHPTNVDSLFPDEVKKDYFRRMMPGKAGPTIIVPWDNSVGENNKPWRQMSRREGHEGEWYDVREQQTVMLKGKQVTKYMQHSQRRYNPKEGTIGGTYVKGDATRRQLAFLGAQGYEFKWIGEVSGMEGHAVYAVIMNEGKKEKITDRGRLVWSLLRYVHQISHELLPAMWSDWTEETINDLAASGQPAHHVFDSRQVNYDEHIFWKEIERGEYSNAGDVIPVTTEWEEVIAKARGEWVFDGPDVSVKSARAPVGEPEVRELLPQTPQSTPLTDLRPTFDVEEKPLSIEDAMEEFHREMAHERTADMAATMDNPRDRASIYNYILKQEGGNHQKAKEEINRLYVKEDFNELRALPRVVDIQNQFVGHVGDYLTLQRVFAEFRLKWKQTYIGHTEIGRRMGKNFTYEPIDNESFGTERRNGLIHDGIHHSDVMKGGITMRTVAHIYRELQAWQHGRPTRTPGLNRAETLDEASTILLKRIKDIMELKLLSQETMGVWTEIPDPNNPGDKIHRHSMGRSSQLSERVRIQLSFPIPTPLAPLIAHSIRIGYQPHRSFELNRKFYDKLHNALDVQDYSPFNGRVDLMEKATREDWEREFAIVAKVEAENKVRLAQQALITRIMKFDTSGLDIDAGGGSKVHIPGTGILQIVDEANDAVKDIKGLLKYVDENMQDATGYKAELMFNEFALNIMGDVAKGMGVDADGVDEVFQAREGPPPPNFLDDPVGIIRNSQMAQDFRDAWEIAKVADQRMKDGDILGAFAVMSTIRESHTASLLKRKHQILNNWAGPVPGFGAGRMLAGVSAPGVGSALVDIKTGPTNRQSVRFGQWLGERIRYFGNKAVESIFPELRQKTYEIKTEYRDKQRVNLSMLEATGKLAPGSGGALNASLSVRLVTSVRWWSALSGGVGATVLAKVAADNGVKTRKRWVVNKRPGLDLLCLRNSRDGWIDGQEFFSSGHSMPPAHPGCECKMRQVVGKGGRSKLMKLMQPQTLIARKRF